MIAAHAPLQLPFGPKPFRKELFSSWLLRLAAANCVSLQELLLGFEASYPSAAYSISLDLNLGLEFLTCMARFSRVPATILGRLSLEKRVAHSSSSLLLGFSNDNFNSDLRLHRQQDWICVLPFVSRWAERCPRTLGMGLRLSQALLDPWQTAPVRSHVLRNAGPSAFRLHTNSGQYPVSLVQGELAGGA